MTEKAELRSGGGYTSVLQAPFSGPLPRQASDPNALRTTWHTPGSVIEDAGASAAMTYVLAAGWAGACRFLADGRRQITRLYVPGDVCGAAAVGFAPNPCATVALTRVKVVEYASVRGEGDSTDAPLVARVKKAQLAYAADMLSHVVRLGRMSAYERMLDLLLELFNRMSAAGATRGNAMDLPLTQSDLADTLGLSTVHTNRVLQQLRREGLIESNRGGRVTVLDLDRMRARAASV